MPSVGMKRSTRIFVPKSVLKGGDDEGRVLRSGKRLWSFSSDVKSGKGSSNEWFPMINPVADDVAVCKSNGCRKIIPKRNFSVKRFRKKLEESPEEKKSEDSPEEKKSEDSPEEKKSEDSPEEKKSEESPEEKKSRSSDDDVWRDKMYGNGYGRKRSSSKTSSSSVFEDMSMENRMYGIQYVRKQRRKIVAPGLFPPNSFSSSVEISELHSECEVLAGNISSDLGENEESLSSVHVDKFEVFVHPSHDSVRLFANFLDSLVNSMRRSSVRLSQLQAFMCSDPIASVYSRHGVRFSNHSSRFSRETHFLVSGNCKIFGARQFLPLFSLNFSAAPFFFMSLHFGVFLRSQHLLYALVRYLMGLLKDDYLSVGGECLPNESVHSLNIAMASGSPSMKRRRMNFVNKSVMASGRNLSTRFNSNSLIRRKRSSLRTARVRRPPMFLRNGRRYSNGLDFIKPNHKVCIQGTDDNDDLLVNDTGCSSFSSLESVDKKKLTSADVSSNVYKELHRNFDSLSCSANLLVVEPDRCSREAGATISLECSSSNDWCIVAKIQGLIRFMVKAEDTMRPSTTNRFTHAKIWIDRNGWKLEFSDRRDWFIFKELYRECVDRNIYAVPPIELPVPGVREVPFDGDMEHVPFVQPDCYIRMHDDEVARALLRRTSNYEVDSGDEEWLKKLNSGLRYGENGHPKLVSIDNFEEMIDVFEKTSYCTPDDVSDENRAIRLCSDLRTDIVAAVYHYWVNKVKLKRSPLLRVFQSAPPRKRSVLQKPFLRKRRSFKRQASKYRRDHKRSFLQAFAEEHDATLRVEESKNSANLAVELAILKRKRAQALMENAELATYKANLALKIAEAAKFGVSSDSFVSFILGHDPKSADN